MNKNLKKFLYYMAIGFGSGLSIFAPGTLASICAIFIWYLIILLFPFKLQQIIIISISFIVGLYICQFTSKIYSHDHKSIVWDEFVGMWLTLMPLEYNLKNIVLGLFFFRFFDILKIWPIKIIHKNIKNGLGIMLDDVIASFYSIFILLQFK